MAQQTQAPSGRGSTPQKAGGTAPSNSSPSSLTVSFVPSAKVFLIGADATMPTIRVSCAGPGIGIEKGQTFQWAVTLTLNPAGVPFAAGRVTTHSPIQSTTQVPSLTIPFTQVRGGTLTVKVTTNVNGKPESSSVSATVLGTNPSSVAVRALPATELLLKLMTLESSFRQFLTKGTKAWYPVFSQDGLGGVGLGQITRPRPSDEEVWNWKANVRAAQRLYQEKEATARSILRQYPTSAAFREKVAEYNRLLAAAPAKPGQSPAPAAVPGGASPATPPHGAPPAAANRARTVTITLPQVTDEMIENETLRLYNGEPLRIHEYEAEVDEHGVLVVTIAPDGTHGTAKWHQVTAAERISRYQSQNLPKKRWGDPDYVRHVRNEVIP